MGGRRVRKERRDSEKREERVRKGRREREKREEAE